MFGYVKIHKASLTVASYEQYQGVYCSLCKRLGHRYGLFSRMSLSYDLTFFALFQMSLEPGCPGFQWGHCSYNPAKKVLCLGESAAVDSAADAAALLTYYKIQDNIRDNTFLRGLPARLLKVPVSFARRKAKKRRPDLDRKIDHIIRQQTELEAARLPSVDAAAAPFAELMQYVASTIPVPEDEKTALARFGYCMGRWIYLIDALDDLEKDLKTDNYNPYIITKKLFKSSKAEDFQAVRDYAAASLNLCLAECEASWHLLTRYRFGDIVGNIITEGMPAEMNRILHKSDPKGETHGDTV